MEPRQLAPNYYVAPQPVPADMAAAARAGFTTVICNRPDAEVTPDLQAAAMRAAAEAAGMRFAVLELVQQTLTPENARRQRELVASGGGRVLAYCRSGTRSSVIWAMGQIGTLGLDGVMRATRAAGYNLDSYLPLLRIIAQNPV